MPIGEALTQLLAERGMTQNELARRIGVTSAAVSLWTTGRSQPTRENVELMEDELAVEPRGWLLTAAGYSVNGTTEGPTIESLIRADPMLEAEDKRVLLRVLRVLRERNAES